MGSANQLAEASLEQNHSRAPKRIGAIDSGKALAVLAVVCLHVPISGAIPGYFFTRSLAQSSFIGLVIRKYLVRIGIVFAFWTVFYTFIPPFVGDHGNVSGWVRAGVLLHHPVHLLLTGGAFHLWFLSALLRALLIIAFCHWIGRIELSVVFGLFQYVTGLANGIYSPLGFHLFFSGGTCVYFFAAAGAVVAVYDLRLSARSALAMAFVGMAIQLAEAFGIQSHYGTPLSHSAFSLGTIPFAIGLFLFTLSCPEFGAALSLHKIGRYSLGVYVIHPYLGAVLRHITPLEPLFRVPPVGVAVLFAASSAATLVLARQRFLAPLLK